MIQSGSQASESLPRPGESTQAIQTIRQLTRICAAEPDNATALLESLDAVQRLAGNAVCVVCYLDASTRRIFAAPREQAYISLDMEESLENAAMQAQPEWFRSGAGLALPLSLHGQSVGALAVERLDGSSISPTLVNVMQIAADLFGLVISLEGLPPTSGNGAATVPTPDAVARDLGKVNHFERMKSQFIATVSHELRTPLAAIKASVGVLLTSMPTDTADPILRLLRNIERSCLRLEALVSDLMDLTRLQSGRVQLNSRRLDVADVARLATTTVQPLAEEKGQTITVVASGQTKTIGDQLRIRQILLNLLSNAHKFSPARSNITIRIEDRGDVVAVGIQDQGPGIPPEEQNLIFDRFYRADTSETQRGTGTGLGLAIARSLVELHYGRIWVESEVGRGSTFWFTLPKEGHEAMHEEMRE